MKKKSEDKRLDIILKEIFKLEKKTDKNFESLQDDFRQLQSAVGAYAKKADTYFQEMVMLAHKVDRLERWILQIAEKAGIHLKA